MESNIIQLEILLCVKRGKKKQFWEISHHNSICMGTVNRENVHDQYYKLALLLLYQLASI